jgi:glycosyltransferase involved in cell wall biosynthesis
MKEKKNICITINSLAPGGAEKQSLLLAKALKLYHNTTVIIVNPRPIYESHMTFITNEDLDHIFLPTNPLKKLSMYTRILKKQKIEIIFSFLPTDTIWGAICGKAVNIPYIFGGIRNSHIVWIKYVILRLINNHLLSYTIANNYAAYISANKFGFKKNVFVIPNGIEIKTISKRQKLDKNLITIISAGRLVKQKDYVTAIKSIAHLKQILNEKYNLKYKIVGQGPEQASIIDTIRKFDVKEEVELITNASDIYDLLESSDIYLCTSVFEGISNSIMEAMNCGLPIVATDAGDNSRLVVDGKNGFITTIGSYKELSQHLGSLIESPDLRERMGLESYDHLKDNFGYQAFQKKYLNLIENIPTLQIKNGEPRI